MNKSPFRGFGVSRFRDRLIVFAALLLAAGPAWATDKYVSATNPVGNDSNNGNSMDADEAYLTIQKAIDNVDTAGTVWVNPGTYAEALVLNGTTHNVNGKTITIARYAAGTVTLAAVLAATGDTAFSADGLATETVVNLTNLSFVPTLNAAATQVFKITQAAHLHLTATNCLFRVAATGSQPTRMWWIESNPVLGEDPYWLVPTYVTTRTVEARFVDCTTEMLHTGAGGNSTGQLYYVSGAKTFILDGGVLNNQGTTISGFDICYSTRTEVELFQLTNMTWLKTSASSGGGLYLFGGASHGWPTVPFHGRIKKLTVTDNTFSGKAALIRGGTENDPEQVNTIDDLLIARNTQTAAIEEFVTLPVAYLGNVRCTDNVFTTTGASAMRYLIELGRYEAGPRGWLDEGGTLIDTLNLCGRADISHNVITAGGTGVGAIQVGRCFEAGTVAYNQMAGSALGTIWVGGRNFVIHHNVILNGEIACWGTTKNNYVINNTVFTHSASGRAFACDRAVLPGSGCGGSLTVRTNATTGKILGLTPFGGLVVGDFGRINWSSPTGSRYGVTVDSVNCDYTTFGSVIAFHGGTGDDLPAASKTVTIYPWSRQNNILASENIFAANVTGGKCFLADTAATEGGYEHGGIRLRGNIYWPTEGASLGTLGATTYTAGQLATYVAALNALAADPDGTLAWTDNELGSSEAAPRFINAAAGDLRLWSDSPAVGTDARFGAAIGAYQQAAPSVPQHIVRPP